MRNLERIVTAMKDIEQVYKIKEFVDRVRKVLAK